jgi:CubicO group peptidase (beta-lactamase class C family)
VISAPESLSWCTMNRSIPLLLFCVALLPACEPWPDSGNEITAAWPGENWELSIPESEGLDAAVIEQLDREIRSGKHGYIDSMLIVRHGRLVFEGYYDHDYAVVNAELVTDEPGPWNYYDVNYYPYYRGSELHSLQSATKSFMSALVGIAIERGDISGVDATLGELLPHRNITDPEKAAITLDNILTMRPGFEWNEWVSYFDPRNDATIVEGLDDWVGYLLDKPLSEQQGTVYNYNSTNTQLMSEMVSTASGMPLDEYARKYLFEPIGIQRYFWNDAPEGFKNVAGGLFLESRDLARFALLLERGGEWNGKQVISADWVKRSTTPWVPDVSPDNPDFDAGYGYQWWVYNHGSHDKPDMYGGWGWGGQFPLVVPELDLVAVFTGWNIYQGQDHESPFRLFYERIVLTAEH